MTNKINILGAGQTSMIAAIMLANRDYKVEILDDKPLKQSHFALLRFKTKAIEEETGIKCEEVEIKKAIFFDGQIYNESNIKFDNLYSRKVTGKIQRRSIGNLGIGKRYIPPVDFFDQLVKKCEKLGIENRIDTGADLKNDVSSHFKMNDPNCNIISTLPMPNLYRMVHQEEVKFEFEKVYVVEFNIPNCNVHQTIYYPEMIVALQPAYRISIVGNDIKCEISEETIKHYKQDEKFTFEELIINLCYQINNSFGIEINDHYKREMITQCLYNVVESVIKEQKFGKISPINEQVRHSIIYNLTKQFGIYSLGRFSCWRQIMLDDVVKDVIKIENLIKLENLSGYEAARTMASRL